MARIRTIKPDFWLDEDLASLSAEANLLAIGLLNQSDDEGYFKANPMLLKAAIFPLRETSVTIHCLLSELSRIGYLELFEGSDGKQYGLVKNFLKHQKINRPTASKYKALREFTEESVSAHQNVSGERKGKEGKGKDIADKSAKRKSTIPDDFELTDDLKRKAVDYWKSKSRALDPDEQFFKFKSHHQAKGTKMLSWDHAWQTWYSNSVTFSKPVLAENSTPHFDSLGIRA